MPKNRPLCSVCGNTMIKNGTTSANHTRWRCTTCAASSTRQRCDITNAAAFARFIEYVTTSATLKSLAGKTGLSPRSLQRRFELFWLIDVPDPRPCHMGRIYDQVFIDGTYTAGGCLLVASSLDHVIAWHWCTTESTAAYSALLDGITAPLIVVTDGGRGAASAINNCWPTTAVQRCLVHAQRIVRRHTTSRPRTNGGRAIYQLALNLTKITSLDQAVQLGPKPTRQSPNPDPQREPSRPRNRTTSPLRQSYRHRLQPLTQHPKRPTLIPTHQQKHILTFNPKDSSK